MSPTRTPIVSPRSVPITGIGINDPSNPPSAAPIPLNTACPIGSPESNDATATIRGPITGILPKVFETNLTPCLPKSFNPSRLPILFAPPFLMLLPLSVPPRDPV